MSGSYVFFCKDVSVMNIRNQKRGLQIGRRYHRTEKVVYSSMKSHSLIKGGAVRTVDHPVCFHTAYLEQIVVDANVLRVFLTDTVGSCKKKTKKGW